MSAMIFLAGDVGGTKTDPVHVILNPKVGLLGAAVYGLGWADALVRSSGAGGA